MTLLLVVLAAIFVVAALFVRPLKFLGEIVSNVLLGFSALFLLGLAMLCASHGLVALIPLIIGLALTVISLFGLAEWLKFGMHADAASSAS